MKRQVTNIRVRSRSTAPLSRNIFNSLESSPHFSKLIEGGIVSLVRSKKVPYGVRAGPYVGSAVIGPDIYFEVLEKEPETLSGLIRWSLPEELRTVDASSKGSDSSSVLTTFALRYVDSVGDYLRSGLIKRYMPRKWISQRPKGKVDVRATMLLRARGRVPEIAATSHELTSDILPNQLIAYGLERAVRLLRASAAKEQVLISSQYLDLFSHCDRSKLNNLPYHMKIAAVDKGLSDAEGSSRLARALQYAQPFIFDGGIGSSDQTFVMPQAYFLNLELIFEAAARQALGEVLACPALEIVKGGSLKKKMFGETSAGFVADPDIVISDGKVPLVVADCKYKTLDVAPDHHDVYQVMSHAATLNCGSAVLLYPGTEYACTLVGSTQNNIRLWTVTLRPSNFANDLHQFAVDLLPAQQSTAKSRHAKNVGQDVG